MRIKVQCYAGYRGEESPQYILLESNKIAVKCIIDRWLAPDHRYFKILGDDDAVYIIRHDHHTATWELTFYQASEAKLHARAGNPDGGA